MIGEVGPGWWNLITYLIAWALLLLRSGFESWLEYMLARGLQVIYLILQSPDFPICKYSLPFRVVARI